MPPPKKPKRGPTSADQFLSLEELTKLRRQRVPSSASESSDTVSGRNSTPPSNTEEPIISEDTETTSDSFTTRRQSSEKNEDVPMNLSSSFEAPSFEAPSNGNSTNAGYGRSSVVFPPSNQSIVSPVTKGELGASYADPEPPVLQRITDTASPPGHSTNRYLSPTRVATASPNMARRLQTPPLTLPRHQSPMLTLMMAVPTSHALWQPSLGLHEATHHTSHFSPLPLTSLDNKLLPPLTSLDNKLLPHLYSQPHDFSKKPSVRSEGGSGRKRKPRYSLLSAALSGSATSTSTVHNNSTTSTSETREHHRKHTIDLLSSPMPTAAALLRLSTVPPLNLLHGSLSHVQTLAESHHNAAVNPNTSINQQTSESHRVGDAPPNSYINNTSDFIRTSQSGFQPFPPPSHCTRVEGNNNGEDNNGLSLLHMPVTNNGVSLPPPSARLMMGSLMAAVSAQPLINNVRGDERLSAPSPDSPVFTGPKLPTDTNSMVSINTRFSMETMTSSHAGSTSSSQSFPLDETRDGCISETSRRDSSRDGDEEIGVSPMQSPISSTSVSGPPPPTSALPTVCTSSCVLPEDRAHMNGSASSIDMDVGAAGLHRMDATFGDLTKIKQEEQLPGSSSGSGVSRQCQVCNDGASGFHYGVWSCEGCKAFFKRSIQGPVDYICPATNNCTIDKHRRKSCQACRLRKCYEVGMTKGTSQRKERRSSSTSSAGTLSRSRKRRPDVAIVTNGTKAKRMGHMAVLVLDALIQADTPILESFHDHSLPPSKTHLLSSLLKLVDRELVYLINWAKHVQGYTDLVLCDQVHLIECCWMELLLLSCAFRSIEYQGKQLVFASDLILDRQVWHLLDMVEVLEQVAAISAQMALYGVHKEELLLLKALSLTNAEVRQLSNPGLLSSMRNNLIDALTATAQKHHPQNWGYVPSLMLLLAHVRQASLQTIGHLQKLKAEGAVPFCDLLKEMLEAQSLPSEEKSALNQCG